MEEFKPNTVVRVVVSNEFGIIKKRCICGSLKSPIHYEVLVIDNDGNERNSILLHIDLELECPPTEIVYG